MKAKHIFLSVLSVITIVFAMSFATTASEDKKSAVKFDATIHDFGMVKEDGGPVTCEFPFINNGEGNLIIFEATAECGCTKPTYPKAPIAPGKTGVITVTYNPLGRPGAFDKIVTVKCNGNPSKVRLKIRGTVAPK